MAGKTGRGRMTEDERVGRKSVGKSNHKQNGGNQKTNPEWVVPGGRRGKKNVNPE